MSNLDKRCCGSGVCIINDAGECWCGQRWDGTKMSFVPLSGAPTIESGAENQASLLNQSEKQTKPKS